MRTQNDGDLIHAPAWEPSARHPRMPVADRAKIFMPFAALRGFEEEIREKQVRLTPKPVLSGEEQEEINRVLQRAEALQRQQEVPRLLARVFEEERPGCGRVLEVEGTLHRVDAPRGLLLLEEETLPLDCLIGLSLREPGGD